MMPCELNQEQWSVKSAIFILNCFFQPQGEKSFRISAVKFGKLFCSKFNCNWYEGTDVNIHTLTETQKGNWHAEQLNNLQCTDCQAMARDWAIALYSNILI
jgi:hypothetical protein